jgi:hypothetical protein
LLIVLKSSLTFLPSSWCLINGNFVASFFFIIKFLLGYINYTRGVHSDNSN